MLTYNESEEEKREVEACLMDGWDDKDRTKIC